MRYTRAPGYLIPNHVSTINNWLHFLLMNLLRIRWGSDVICVSDPDAVQTLFEAADHFEEGRRSPLPFELTPGLFGEDPRKQQSYGHQYPIPGSICDVTHRFVYELTGLEFPAALRVVSTTGDFEDLLVVRAWLRKLSGVDAGLELVLDGYQVIPSTHEVGHHHRAAVGDDVTEIHYRNIDATFKRVRPRVSVGGRAVSREVTWPLAPAELRKAREPRIYKKAELAYESIAPHLLHAALCVLHLRGEGSVKELAVALGVPDKQAAALWKGFLADGLMVRDRTGRWVLNEGSQRHIDKKRPHRLKRKEASALIEQLVKSAQAINNLPEGESALFITGMEVYGPYLDIYQDEFDFLYVTWSATVRLSKRWPYVPDLHDPKTGFAAVRAKLNPGDKRLRLLDAMEVPDLNCRSMAFFKFTAPTVQLENAQ